MFSFSISGELEKISGELYLDRVVNKHGGWTFKLSSVDENEEEKMLIS